MKIVGGKESEVYPNTPAVLCKDDGVVAKYGQKDTTKIDVDEDAASLRRRFDRDRIPVKVIEREIEGLKELNNHMKNTGHKSNDTDLDRAIRCLVLVCKDYERILLHGYFNTTSLKSINQKIDEIGKKIYDLVEDVNYSVYENTIDMSVIEDGTDNILKDVGELLDFDPESEDCDDLNESQIKVVENSDGVCDVEQGPINLNNSARKEMQYWIYNETPVTVFRGDGRAPEEIIKVGGMRPRKFSLESLEYHLSGSAYKQGMQCGGAVSTTKSQHKAEDFMKTIRKTTGKESYLYKIELKESQGVDMLKTIQGKSRGINRFGHIVSPPERVSPESLQWAMSEQEISIIGCVGVDQISVWDDRERCFVPLSNASTLKKQAPEPILIPVKKDEPLQVAPKNIHPKWSDLTKIEGQKGSNPGGVYQDSVTGKKYYIKEPASEDIARNEVMAAKLYKAAGVDVPNVFLLKDGKRIKVASEIIDGIQQGGRQLTSDKIQGIRGNFMVDAWLANWDVVGLFYDNFIIQDSKAIRIDTGGSLRYRAQGGLKGEAFGGKVLEIESLRDSTINPQSAEVFASVTREDMIAGARKVLVLGKEQITELVEYYGPIDKQECTSLINILVARQRYIAERYPEAK